MPLQWKIVGIADLNQDGVSDLIWRNTQTGDVNYWLMSGINQMTTGTIAQAVPAAWQIAGTADLNGDGKTDLIWRNTSTGDVTVWYMNGATWMGSWDYIARGVRQSGRSRASCLPAPPSQPILSGGNTQTGDVTVWDMTGADWTGNWDYIARGVPLYWQIVRPH